MANYKLVFRTEQEEIPWEPGCPIMFTAIQVSRNVETSEAYLQAKVRNVSGEKVESLGIWIKPKFDNGTSDGMQVDFLDADIPAGQETVLTPSKFPRGDISSCELTIAWATSQSESWKTSGETGLAPVPTGPALELSPRALEQRMRNIAGGDAQLVSERSVQDHGSWWVCACGQVNVRRDNCCKCSYSKELLVENEDEAKLLAEADEHDAERLRKAEQLQQKGSIVSLSEAIKTYKSLENGEGEDVSGRLAECEEKLSILKKKRMRQLPVIAVALVLVVSAIHFVIQVTQKAALVETVASSQVGKTVDFGEYEQDNDTSNGKESITWKVLAREDDRILLISEKILDFHEYYEELGPFTTLSYESSDLSAWLKGEFADTAFSKGERDAIIDGPFCLSESELEDYFPTSADQICYTTPYVQSQYPEHLNALGAGYWWLSSRGPYVSGDYVYAGCVRWFGGTSGSELTSPCGVRPAIWVQL